MLLLRSRLLLLEALEREHEYEWERGRTRLAAGAAAVRGKTISGKLSCVEKRRRDGDGQEQAGGVARGGVRGVVGNASIVKAEGVEAEPGRGFCNRSESPMGRYKCTKVLTRNGVHFVAR